MTVKTYNPLADTEPADQRGTGQLDTGISVTSAAADHIRRQMANQSGALGFRVGVKKSGCSGFMYVVDLVREPQPGDTRFEVEKGLAIYVDANSLPVLEGTQVDFVSEGINRVFRFNNPNTDASCGCGESFSVKTNAV